MKRKLSVIAVLCCSVLAYSQVGINTQAPQATLDVTAKNTNGTTPEGFIPPRLTGNQVQAADAQYGVNQRGAIIYATAAVTSPSTKTANITSEGYYYFNGSLWQSIGISSAPSLILPNYANNGAGISLTPSNWLNWNYTGTSITLPANSKYIINLTQFLRTGTMPANQSFRITTSFADSNTATFSPSPDLVLAQYSTSSCGPLSIHGELQGKFIINNISSNPKTYYFFAGSANVIGYTDTITCFGGKVYNIDIMYATRVN